MSSFARLLPVLLLLLISSACNNSSRKTSTNPSDLPDASGGYSDVIVVVSDDVWKNKIEEDLKFLLSSPIKGLYNPEPNFDITKINKASFSGLFQVQRAILLIEKDPKAQRTGLFNIEKKYAEGQLMLKVVGKSTQDISDILFVNSVTLQKSFETHRLKALKQNAFENRSAAIINKIREKQGFTIEVPNGYQIIHNNEEIMYCSKQSKAMCDYGIRQECYYQNGIFVSLYDYDAQNQLDQKAIIKKRNELTKAYVFGPERKEKTYMEVEDEFEPHFERSELDGNYCSITKGWWNMVNATMGGPFVNLTFVNKDNNKVVMIDGFCFAPNFDKRQFILEMEAIARTIRFY